MPTRTRTFVLVFLALLTTIALGAWIDLRGRVRTLPDGSRLYLLRTAFAAGFSYEHRPSLSWWRLVLEHLPASWQPGPTAAPGPAGFRLPPGPNTNLYLVTVQARTPPRPSLVLERLVVLDDDGEAFEACPGPASATLWSGDEVVQGWQLNAFPRRTRHLRVRFLAQSQSGDWMTAAEFRIKQPARGPHPTWTPAPLPATATDDGLTVTLMDFATGLRSAEPSEGEPKTPGYTREFTRLEWRLKDEAARPSPWQLQRLRLSDATGNAWEPVLEQNPPRVGPSTETSDWARFVGRLWPSESAWRVRLEFNRTNGLPAEERLPPVEVVLPAPGQVTPLDTPLGAGLNRIRLEIIGGVGAPLPQPFASMMAWPSVNLGVITSTLGPHQYVQVLRAVDDRGRLVRVQDNAPGHRGEKCYALAPARDAKSVRIEFAVPRSRVFEFLAQPEPVPSPNISPSHGLAHPRGDRGDVFGLRRLSARSAMREAIP